MGGNAEIAVAAASSLAAKFQFSQRAPSVLHPKKSGEKRGKEMKVKFNDFRQQKERERDGGKCQFLTPVRYIPGRGRRRKGSENTRR